MDSEFLSIKKVMISQERQNELSTQGELRGGGGLECEHIFSGMRVRDYIN